jgi:hypothetical protein
MTSNNLEIDMLMCLVSTLRESIHLIFAEIYKIGIIINNTNQQARQQNQTQTLNIFEQNLRSLANNTPDEKINEIIQKFLNNIKKQYQQMGIIQLPQQIVWQKTFEAFKLRNNGHLFREVDFPISFEKWFLRMLQHISLKFLDCPSVHDRFFLSSTIMNNIIKSKEWIDQGIRESFALCIEWIKINSIPRGQITLPLDWANNNGNNTGNTGNTGNNGNNGNGFISTLTSSFQNQNQNRNINQNQNQIQLKNLSNFNNGNNGNNNNNNQHNQNQGLRSLPSQHQQSPPFFVQNQNPNQNQNFNSNNGNNNNNTSGEEYSFSNRNNSSNANSNQNGNRNIDLEIMNMKNHFEREFREREEMRIKEFTNKIDLLEKLVLRSQNEKDQLFAVMQDQKKQLEMSIQDKFGLISQQNNQPHQQHQNQNNSIQTTPTQTQIQKQTQTQQPMQMQIQNSNSNSNSNSNFNPALPPVNVISDIKRTTSMNTTTPVVTSGHNSNANPNADKLFESLYSNLNLNTNSSSSPIKTQNQNSSTPIHTPTHTSAMENNNNNNDNNQSNNNTHTPNPIPHSHFNSQMNQFNHMNNNNGNSNTSNTLRMEVPQLNVGLNRNGNVNRDEIENENDNNYESDENKHNNQDEELQLAKSALKLNSTKTPF